MEHITHNSTTRQHPFPAHQPRTLQHSNRMVPTHTASPHAYLPKERNTPQSLPPAAAVMTDQLQPLLPNKEGAPIMAPVGDVK